jgi:beta-N-acetylhexosaminidase
MNLAARSVTIIKPVPSGSVFPLTKETAGRVLLAGKYRDFFIYGRAAFPNSFSYSYSYSTDTADIVSYARNADTVIFCLSDSYDLRLLRSLQSMNKRVIVLSILSPAYLESVNWVTGAVAVYSYSPASFAAGFSAITGNIPAHGILPYER